MQAEFIIWSSFNPAPFPSSSPAQVGSISTAFSSVAPTSVAPNNEFSSMQAEFNSIPQAPPENGTANGTAKGESRKQALMAVADALNLLASTDGASRPPTVK